MDPLQQCLDEESKWMGQAQQEKDGNTGLNGLKRLLGKLALGPMQLWAETLMLELVALSL